MMDLNSVISSLEDDIQEFNLEKDIKTSVKVRTFQFCLLVNQKML